MLCCSSACNTDGNWFSDDAWTANVKPLRKTYRWNLFSLQTAYLIWSYTAEGHLKELEGATGRASWFPTPVGRVKALCTGCGPSQALVPVHLWPCLHASLSDVIGQADNVRVNLCPSKGEQYITWLPDMWYPQHHRAAAGPRARTCLEASFRGLFSTRFFNTELLTQTRGQLR